MLGRGSDRGEGCITFFSNSTEFVIYKGNLNLGSGLREIKVYKGALELNAL